MTRDDDLVRRALEQIERGLPLPKEIAESEEWKSAAPEYERLKQVLQQSAAGERPSAGWQQRVWERIDGERSARSRPLRWVAAVASLAAVAAIVMILIVPSEVGFVARVVNDTAPPESPVRAPTGSRYELSATTGGANHAELRIYRNDVDLVLRCSTEPPCTRSRGRVEASFGLDAVGNYQPMLIVSEQPIPPPAGRLDDDAAAAMDSGARIELDDAVTIY